MNDTQYLQLALIQAQLGLGMTAPNPAVGAVLVKEGKVIGQGYHHAAGQKHAEIEAFDNSTQSLEGATLYVTLEPCCHWGKTPPCTQAISARGLKRVIFGYSDPNPQVAGKGEAFLNSNQIPCEKLPLPEIARFYAPYQKWTVKKLPYVTAKLALSWDGRLAYPKGKRAFITGDKALRFTHEQRKKSDALLTSVRTILNDDPQLNVRLEAATEKKPVYVLDTRLEFPLSARLIKSSGPITLFHGAQASPLRRDPLRQLGLQLVEMPPMGTYLDWKPLLEWIAEQGKHTVWVEAGARFFETLHLSGLLDRAFLIYGPLWIGEGGISLSVSHSARRPQSVSWSSLAEDGLCEIQW